MDEEMRRVIAAFDPEVVLEHLPKKNADAVIRALCTYRNTAGEALDRTLDAAEMEEKILFAEHFPRYGSEKQLTKIAIVFIIAVFIVTAISVTAAFIVGLSSFWLDQTVIDIAIQGCLWVAAFVVATFLLLDGERGPLSGESCVLTTHRAIRVFDPSRWSRSFTESFWYDTIDPYWLQVLKEKRKLASYSLLFLPPPTKHLTFEEALEGGHEGGDQLGSGKVAGNRKFSEKNSVSWMPLGVGGETLVEENAHNKEQAWLATEADRVGFLRLEATRDTVLKIFEIIRENASPTFVSYTQHHCTLEVGAWKWIDRPTLVATEKMEDDEWKDIEASVKQCRVHPLLCRLPLLLFQAIFLVLIIGGLISSYFMAFLMCNSSTIFVTIFALNYFSYRNWVEICQFQIMEKVDVTVKLLNIKYRMHGTTLLNRNMKVDIKSFDLPSSA